MITKCPYCDYSKPDKPLSLDILRVQKEPGLPIEDYWLWMQRLIETQNDLSAYRGVKVHIGLKHKGVYNWPALVLSDAEKAVIEHGA